MNQNKVVLAVFDFDGTLTSGHLWMGIARHHWKNNVKRLPLIGYIVSHLPLLPLVKMRLFSPENNRARWGEDLVGLFKGFDSAKTEKTFRWVMNAYFWPLMRQDVIQRLNHHREQGHTIVLLSGMFVDFLGIMGQRLHADYVIGTKMEIKDGCYTGRIVKPLCFGINKVKCLQDWVDKEQLRVDWSASSALADSYYDLPVLEIFGYPVATYPDQRLRALAKQRRWEILEGKS